MRSSFTSPRLTMSLRESGSWTVRRASRTAASLTAGCAPIWLLRALGIRRCRSSGSIGAGAPAVNAKGADGVVQALGELEKTSRTCYKGRVLGPDEFRRVLGHFATGVPVVTACDAEGRPTGLTASAFASVSLDPPLVLVCVAHKAQAYPAILAAGRFAVNILSTTQEAVSRRFASSSLSGAEKFEGSDYRQGALGLPLLK